MYLTQHHVDYPKVTDKDYYNHEETHLLANMFGLKYEELSPLVQSKVTKMYNIFKSNFISLLRTPAFGAQFTMNKYTKEQVTKFDTAIANIKRGAEIRTVILDTMEAIRKIPGVKSVSVDTAKMEYPLVKVFDILNANNKEGNNILDRATQEVFDGTRIQSLKSKLRHSEYAIQKRLLFDMGFIDSKMLEEINLLELDPYKNSNLIMGIKGEPIILRRDMPSNYSRLFQTKFFDGIYKSISALYENSSEVFQYKRKRAIERLRKNKLFDDMIIPEMRELYYKTYAEIDISTEIKGKAIASNLVTEEELQKNTRETTPNMVNSLKPNEVFVFGSNAEGIHGEGAALTAKTKFGAIQGQSRGLQGQSYAIVTKKNWRVAKSSTLDEIQTEISNFLDFANKNPNKTFYVTKLGSSLAGYSIKEIKNLFENLKMNIPDNVILPEEYEVRDIDNSEKQYRYITEKIVNNLKVLLQLNSEL